MVQKIIVGLQQKIGQPNFGSLGASCSIELSWDDDEALRPEQVASQVRQAFAQCRESISRELASHRDHVPPVPRERTAQKRIQPEAGRSPVAKASNGKPTRMASEAQVRAIRTIASKAGISLASELEQGFGVQYPDELTVSQASQLIDSMKQGLTPSPA